MSTENKIYDEDLTEEDIESIVNQLMKEVEMPHWMRTLHPAAIDDTMREDIRKKVRKASYRGRMSLIKEIVRLQYREDELRESLPSAD